jgi:hypothetical protein
MIFSNILKYYSYTFSEKHILSNFYFKNHCCIIDGVLKYKNGNVEDRWSEEDNNKMATGGRG